MATISNQITKIDALQAQIKAERAQLAAIKKAEKAHTALIVQITAMIEAHNKAHVLCPVVDTDFSGLDIPDAKKALKPDDKRVGKKVVKYRNPKQPLSETWSGIGQFPRWIIRELYNNIQGFKNKTDKGIRDIMSKDSPDGELKGIGWHYIQKNFRV